MPQKLGILKDVFQRAEDLPRIVEVAFLQVQGARGSFPSLR
jgi:hypothetical protein